MNIQSLFSTIFLFAICLSGCTGPGTDEHASESSAHSHADGTHTHADGTVHANHSSSNHEASGGHSHDNPPHGGTVLDWGGGKYHLEVVFDKANQQACVYVLGSNVKDSLAIEAEEVNLALQQPDLELTLKASPQEGDPEGKSSRFVGKHESFATEQKFSGTIFGSVDGTPYSGNFEQK